MNISVKEIAKIVNGEITGNSDIKIHQINKIEKSELGDISFISNSKYEKFLYSTNASCVIINKDLEIKSKIKPTLIIVEDSYLALSKLTDVFSKSENKKNKISSNCIVDESSKIDKNVNIGHYSIIGENCNIEKNVKIFNNCVIGNNVTIKKNTIIYSQACIKDNCIIGENNYIHSGSVIGSDGFGFAPKENALNKIKHLGNVITKNNVEIGSNTTIDRASIGSTIINEGVKLDNLIQIGHNVEIGKNTAIAGLTAIAGSTKIGENCLIGGQCAITGHITIGNNVRIAGNSGIGGNIKDNQTVQGIYAFNKQDFQRSYILFKGLPKIVKKLDQIRKDLNN
tara:strand:- start:67 stop:1086 length:1020 start_codon:yes stop_codon:yes gene_type:complete